LKHNIWHFYEFLYILKKVFNKENKSKKIIRSNYCCLLCQSIPMKIHCPAVAMCFILILDFAQCGMMGGMGGGGGGGGG